MGVMDFHFMLILFLIILMLVYKVTTNLFFETQKSNITRSNKGQGRKDVRLDWVALA